MTTNKTTKAIIKHSRSISPIWLIPMVAVFIGGWMLYQNISQQGVLIKIEFNSAQGIEKDKTLIKYKNVLIGKVKKIELTDETKKVIVSCRIKNRHRKLLREDTKFWVVRPHIGSQGISGLDTLISGAYIEVTPGEQEKEQTDFIGLEAPPVTPAGTPGIHITLDNKGDKTLEVGDKILFRGITVGKIEHVFFNTEERTVYYNTFIESPYDKLITTNTRFWQVNGVEFELSADGVRVETGTLDTIVQGGVSFDIPKNMTKGKVVAERAYFTIYPNKKSINNKIYNHSIAYILFFNQSIRGLKINAPVEFRGVKIGHVVRTDMDYPNIGNLLNQKTKLPILISIDPARVGMKDNHQAVNQLRKQLDKWIQHGLHAKLATGNLLTGSKIIELHYGKTKNIKLSQFNNYRVIPALAGGINQIIEKITKVVDKVYQLPLNKMANNTNNSLLALTKALKQLDKILAAPETHQLTKDTHIMLNTINQVAKNFAKGGAGQKALQQNLTTLKQVLDQLRPLLIELNRKPNSLVFTGEKAEDIEPKGVE